MRSTALRALLALVLVAAGALALGLARRPSPSPSPAAPAPQAPDTPGPASPAATPPAAGDPAATAPSAAAAEGVAPSPAPAREAWDERRLAAWLGQSALAALLVWAVKVALLLAGIGCLAHEILLEDRRRHGLLPAGWGRWQAGQDARWPTAVATPGTALALFACFVVGVQLVMVSLWPPGKRPLGDVEFGILAVTLALAPLALLVLMRRQRLGPPGLPRARAGVVLGLKFACIAALLVLPVQLAWGWLMVVTGQPLEVQDVVRHFAAPDHAAQPWLIAAFGVLVAPVTEEAVFRGLLYPSLRERMPGGRFGAAVLVSLVFAAIHGNMMAFVPLFALAMVLAWVMERTNSLLACIVVHAVHNASSLAPMLARLLQGGGAA